MPTSKWLCLGYLYCIRLTIGQVLCELSINRVAFWLVQIVTKRHLNCTVLPLSKKALLYAELWIFKLGRKSFDITIRSMFKMQKWIVRRRNEILAQFLYIFVPLTPGFAGDLSKRASFNNFEFAALFTPGSLAWFRSTLNSFSVHSP